MWRALERSAAAWPGGKTSLISSKEDAAAGAWGAFPEPLGQGKGLAKQQQRLVPPPLASVSRPRPYISPEAGQGRGEAVLFWCGPVKRGCLGGRDLLVGVSRDGLGCCFLSELFCTAGTECARAANHARRCNTFDAFHGGGCPYFFCVVARFAFFSGGLNSPTSSRVRACGGCGTPLPPSAPTVF